MIVPAPVVREIVAHARAREPWESCGLVVLRDNRAERYIPCRNVAESPASFELDADPDVWLIPSELAVVHSHVEASAAPSGVDVELVGLWDGHPYLIYSLADDELAGWTIRGRVVQPLEVVVVAA